MPQHTRSATLLAIAEAAGFAEAGFYPVAGDRFQRRRLLVPGPGEQHLVRPAELTTAALRSSCCAIASATRLGRVVPAQPFREGERAARRAAREAAREEVPGLAAP